MKKVSALLATSIFAFSVLASSALAAPSEEKGSNPNGKGSEVTVKVTGTDKKDTVTGNTYGDTVTESTYKQGNGYIGLQKAYENVKDKPSGQVIANLLSKYGVDVNAQVLDQAVTELEAQGETQTAADLQAEVIQLDVTNLDAYKKLGKLKNKLGKTGVKAYVNGVEPKFEVAPFIKDGSTLVPFRAISESLKAEVTWNAEERSVTVTKGDITIKLFIGSTTAYVNGKEITLEVPGEITNGSTMVPARFISESLKATVKWESETQSVVIYDEVKVTE